MSSTDLRNELAAIIQMGFDQLNRRIDGRFDQFQTQVDQINARMDVLTELVRQRHQQNPADGDQVDQDRGVDEAINAGDTGTKDDDQQDAVSVKSEIDTGSCQCEFDDWLKEEEDIAVKKEELVEDSGTGGQQQPEDQTIFQPVAGPSGMCRTALKRPQSGPADYQPRRSSRLGTIQYPLNQAESSESDDEDEINSSPASPPPPTKKARINKRQRCPQCSKMVTNLDIHLRRHLGEKSHHCGQCEKRFVTNYELLKHYRQVHSIERPYRCSHPSCGYTAATKYKLEKHLQSKKHQSQ